MSLAEALVASTINYGHEIYFTESNLLNLNDFKNCFTRSKELRQFSI
jgi:hypothetical protein